MAQREFDDAIVGVGVIGLAHAYHLAMRRRRVIVFERGPQAPGASIRNFGMIWPIGQPAGEMYELARRSRPDQILFTSIGLQLRVRCGAICLIVLFAALSHQERSASKQLAPQLPYTQSQTAQG